MGKSVLASQSFAGLRPELKKNIAGSDLTSIDELLDFRKPNKET